MHGIWYCTVTSIIKYCLVDLKQHYSFIQSFILFLSFTLSIYQNVYFSCSINSISTEISDSLKIARNWKALASLIFHHIRFKKTLTVKVLFASYTTRFLAELQYSKSCRFFAWSLWACKLAHNSEFFDVEPDNEIIEFLIGNNTLQSH